MLEEKTDKRTTLGKLSTVSSKVAYRRMKLAGNCIQHPEEIASKLVLWQPAVGRRSVGRYTASFIDALLKENNIDNINELKTSMLSRNNWKKHAKHLRVGTRPK